MSISLYSWPNFITAAYTLLLGIFVFFANPKEKANLYLFLLTLASSLWLFCYGIAYSLNDPGKVLAISKIGHSGVILMNPIFLFFIIAILKDKSNSLDAAIAWTAVTYAVINLALLHGTNSYLLQPKHFFWGYTPTASIHIALYAMWTAMLFIRCIYVFSRAASKSKKEMRQEDYRRFKHLSISVCIFALCALDYLPKFNTGVYPFGYLFVAIFTTLTTYAIIKHKLLDIDVLIRQGATYAALTAGIILTFIFFSFFTEHILRLAFNYSGDLSKPYSFNIYACINGLNSALTFAIMIFVLTKRKKALHGFYVFWELILGTWTFSYFQWGMQTERGPAEFWLKIILYSVCFIHTGYLHFTLSFTDKLNKYKKLLLASYLSSFVLALLARFDLLSDFSQMRERYNFMFWPHAGKLLPVLIIVQVLTALFSFKLLFNSMMSTTPDKRPRLFALFTSNAAAWIGGLTNWIPWYDAINLPPIGNVILTVDMLIVLYLIFKLDLLEMNLAIKKTFIYGALIFFFTFVLSVFVIIIDRTFQAYLGSYSVLITFVAAATITLLFNPAQRYFQSLSERLIFGKDIVSLSNENVLLMKEIQKSDQMRAIATMAAGMAHEIKNPLSSIKTFTEFLPQKYDDPLFREKFFRIVTDEVDRVNNIVKQLLEFSRPASPQLAECEISTVIDETLDLLNQNFVKNDISVIKNYGAKAKVKIDRKQIKQCILNILLNSIQATPRNGTIITSTSLEGHYLRFDISDNGAGISDEILPRIFEPFFSTKDEGTGLGLTIVEAIIREHKGKIRAGKNPSGGTTISIYLKTYQTNELA